MNARDRKHGPARWKKALCLGLASAIASAPVAARGPGRAGVGALLDDLDGGLPPGANAPAYMRPAFEQLVPLLRDDAKVSGSQFGVRGDIPISVSPDAVGGAPDGMVLGGAQFSAEGDLVVPLLNVASNATVNGRPAVPAVLASFGRLELIPKLPALRSVEIPPVAGIGTFIRDRKAAIALGKAFFWDANVGSDGNACASCHFAAGADNRLKNQLSPGLLAGDSAFSRHLPSSQRRGEMRALASEAAPAAEPKRFRGVGAGGGPNYTLRPSDFPFYRLADPLDRNSAVVFESNDVVSSQGTFSGPFGGASGGAESCGNRGVDEFSVHGALTRRVAPRNSPSVINAVFNFRNFWDGRANNVFNGVNPFGDRDDGARVLERKPDGSVKPVRVSLPNASLASQAVGPALSEFEMSCAGKTFRDLGRKMLPLQPLGKQQVHAQDSVLGAMVVPGGRGLATTYAEMIRKAFHEDWWSGDGVFDGFTQMESNFSLFWGLAIMAYEATLVSDEAPVDRFVGWAGTPPDASALRPPEIRGLELFRGKALCVSCHKGAEFTSAATGLQPYRETNLTEQMFVGKGQIGLYDNGFYNIGVRPTVEDLGVGARDPFGYPLSFSRQYLELLRGKVVPDAFFVRTCLFAVRTDAKECWTPPDPERTRVGVDGAFKTPTLRNVALTQPYFHNGSRFTLEQVVEFYNRGGDRRGPDGNDTSGYGSPDAPGGGPSNSHPSIRPLGLTTGEQADLVAFLRYGLTDRRVACRKAPFDHPSLELPNGHAGNERRVRVESGRAVDDFITLTATGAWGVADAECYRNDNGTLLDGTAPLPPATPKAPSRRVVAAASTLPVATALAAPAAPVPAGPSAPVGASPGAPALVALAESVPPTAVPISTVVPVASASPAVASAASDPVAPVASVAPLPAVPSAPVAASPVALALVAPAENVPPEAVPTPAVAPVASASAALASAASVPAPPAVVIAPAGSAVPPSVAVPVPMAPAANIAAGSTGTVSVGGTAFSSAIAQGSPGIASPAGSTPAAPSAGAPDSFGIGGFRMISFAEVTPSGSTGPASAAPTFARSASTPAGGIPAGPSVAPETAMGPSSPAAAGSAAPARLRDMAPWLPPTAPAEPAVAPPPAEALPIVEERRLVVTSSDRALARPEGIAVRASTPVQPGPDQVAQASAPPPATSVPAAAAPLAQAPKQAPIPERKGEPEPRTVEFQAWTPAPAPKLEFDNLDGTPFDAGALRGKRVVLNFWAVWCVPCREEIPALQRMADAMKGQGVEIVLVNLGDSREAIERFLQKVPTRLRIMRVRGDAPRAGDWNVTALPATILVDPAGVPRWRAIGRVDGRANEALLLKRLAEIARLR